MKNDGPRWLILATVVVYLGALTSSFGCSDGGGGGGGPAGGGGGGAGAGGRGGTGGATDRGGTGGGTAGTSGGSGGATSGTSGGTAGLGGTGGGAAGTVGGGGPAGAGGGPAGTGGGAACVETNPPLAQAAACSACIAIYAGPDDGCCGLATRDPTGFTLCQAASACMRTGGAPTGLCNVAGDTTTCYCGTNVSSCDGDPPANGPCIGSITAAAGRNVMTMTTDAPTPAEILTRFGQTDYAIGRATSVHSYAGAFCAEGCGFPVTQFRRWPLSSEASR